MNYLEIVLQVFMSNKSLVLAIDVSESFNIHADFFFAKIDRHIRFHLVLQVQAHLSLQKALSMFDLIQALLLRPLQLISHNLNNSRQGLVSS